jgi:hypothetical protein
MSSAQTSKPFAEQLAETIPGAKLVTLADEDHPSAIRADRYKYVVAEFLRAQGSIHVG